MSGATAGLEHRLPGLARAGRRGAAAFAVLAAEPRHHRDQGGGPGAGPVLHAARRTWLRRRGRARKRGDRTHRRALHQHARTTRAAACSPSTPSTRCCASPSVTTSGCFCDEAYEEIYFDREPPDAIWKRPDIRDRAIAFHTLSKTYGFAGARVGFTHGPARRHGRGPRDADLPHLLCAPPDAVRRGGGAAAGRRLGGREPRRSTATPDTRRPTHSAFRGPKAARSCSST